MERFAADPTASVPKACHGWGETMTAYRFFDNDSVDCQEIMAPHLQQTQQRMAASPVVLCLQNTTKLDFNGQCVFGLGPLSYEAQCGMYLHPTTRPRLRASRWALSTRGCGRAKRKTSPARAADRRKVCAGSRVAFP